jgi:signal transduction histidine kinase/ActR/RegA family two-component response regulator/HAMP domain-containing protein
MRLRIQALARRLIRHSRGLRRRLTVLLIAGLFLSSAGFEALLVSLTWHSEHEQLEDRARSIARLMVQRSLVPLASRDVTELEARLHRAVIEPDVLGAAVYPSRGPILAQRNLDRPPWPELGPPVRYPKDEDVAVRYRRTSTGTVLDVTAPIMGRPGQKYAPPPTPFEHERAVEPLPAGRPCVGWVRLAFSTVRAEQAVQNAAQLGLILLLLTCILGLFAVSLVVRIILRPLSEARDLAREIASGQLDRRLPVRSLDELGDLAVSMNTMAGALSAARCAAENEAGALRTASSAMLTIAADARDAQDPARLFALVARELKRVTRARSVALAVPAEHGQAPAFAHFDPPAPWGGLVEGRAVPDDLVRRLAALGDAALRLDTEGGLCECSEMASDGFCAILLVPLHLPDSPPAVLLAAADDPAAFTASEQDLVLALASHLSSALRAGRLQARLEEAFDELQRTHDYLVQSEMLRVAGEMASGVAHDFNNVLGAILGRTQLLTRRIEAGELSSEDLLTSLAVIERAAQDGRETGRRLRQFGHVAQGSMSEAVELPAVVRDAVEFTRPRWQNEAQAAGIAVDVHVDAEPGTWVAGRASELREVFTNLILNSLDALPAGGTVEVTVRADATHVVAAVTDDGTGMDEETEQRLFEPFFTTKGNDGTGLGLSVVYGIVQRHGGTIGVQTRPGAGTRMEVRLPRVGAPLLAAPAPGPVEALAEMDVLVVDDDQAVREVLRDTATALGQRAVACSSGPEALGVFRPGAFQLVLTDLGMPDMTGWELTRLLRAIDPEVTIVFVTGWGQDVDSRAATETGADLVLAKPFEMADVARAISLASTRLAERSGELRAA